MKPAILLFLLISFAGTDPESAIAQSISNRNLDSLARLYNISVSKLTSPELEERKRIRREMQRSCYANVLSDVLAHDALSALISYVKVKLQIEYSISHRPILLFARQGDGRMEPFVLSDDWTFPEDPWKKE